MSEEKAKRIIEGLNILDKYPGNYIAAEHDILYAGNGSPEDISETDKKRLDELGWFIEEDTDSWAIFT